MGKRIVHTIIYGLLCASGFAQGVQIPGEVSFLHLHSTKHYAGWTATLTGDFEQAWKTVIAPTKIEERTNSCALAGSRLLENVSRGRENRHASEVEVWQLPESQDFFFVSGMTIDADGAPNAYNPDDTGLDALANAGAPGHWDGIITDRSGHALIQQQSDPFPGYYISCTSLSDETKHFTDPTGYVDASKIPYIALPQDVAERGGAKLGDFAVVMNLRNGKSSFAIYADVGTMGEGSLALADALGIWSDARNGGASDGILYLLFPGSGNRKPRSIGEIQREGEKLVYRWGGTKELSSCSESYAPAAQSGDF
jgi:Fungal chitosanase of glycosyl hydrolase group 75